MSLRIVIATMQVPFVWGGAEVLSHSLCDALRAAGHEAEIVAIPFKWYPPEKIMDHVLACRLLDLTESNGTPIDRVIGLKFPAYLAPHPNKVNWILHQYRTAFDLWDTPDCDLRHFPNGRRVRQAIDHLDATLLLEARHNYTISQNVANRMRRFSHVEGTALYPPVPNPERFHHAEQGDFIFYPSRLCALKRQFLVIQALGETRSNVRVRFAGKPDNPQYLAELEALAARHKVSERITWLGNISEEEKIRQYATCRAVIFPPHDEDYGYVTLEAMLSRKPVITCKDSGGPLEFVQHEKTGLVTASTPAELGAAMDRIHREPRLAAEMGQAGYHHLQAMDVTWDKVVRALTG